MRPRTLLTMLFPLCLAAALPAAAQEGLRVPSRPVTGIDPSFAGGWLNPRPDGISERFGFGQYHWRDAIGFAPAKRMQWSYSLGQHGSVGMSVYSGRDYFNEPVFGVESRQYGLVGRYSLTPDWSLSAETVAREPGTMLRLNDLRIGIRRQF